MANVEVKLNTSGVRELMRSPEMKNICEEYANKALGRLGSGYIVTTYTGRNRVNASVYAESYEAKRENMQHNTILKAIRG